VRTYRAISIWQPWATLIASGAKKIETRTWAPRWLHMGEPVLIHASKRWTEDEQDLLDDPMFQLHLSVAAARGLWNFDAPPLGCIVAVATFNVAWRSEELLPKISAQERYFGAYAPGYWGWHFPKVRPIAPIPYRGRQGIFPVTLDEAELVYVEAGR
jgi:activating signal cointegrator 1